MLTKIKKRLNLTTPARASVWYTASGVIERGIAFIFTPIFTRSLSREEYGLYSLYISWMGLFTIFVTLELTGNVIYKGLSKFKGREDELISCSLGLMTVSALLVLTLFIIFEPYAVSILGLSRGVCLMLIAHVYANGVISLYSAKCRYSYKYKSQSLINLLQAAIPPTVAFMLINFTRVRAEARIISTMAVSVAVCLPLIVGITRRGGRLFKGDVWRYLIRFTLPLLPHFIATTVTAQAGKLFIGRFLGEGALAQYSIVFSMGFLLNLLTGGIQSALTPWINRKLRENAEEKIDRTAERAFVLLSIATLLGLCFSPEGLAFLAPPEYRGALAAIYPLCISVLISFLVMLINAVMLYYEKGYLTTICSVIGAILSIALNYVFTPRLGYISAAMIQLAISVVNLLISYAMMGGVLKKRASNPRSYVISATLTIFAAGVLFSLRYSFVSRVLLFLALTLMIIPRAIECKDLIFEKKKAERI